MRGWHLKAGGWELATAWQRAPSSDLPADSSLATLMLGLQHHLSLLKDARFGLAVVVKMSLRAWRPC